MSENNQEPSISEGAAIALRRMAERIEKNHPDDFSGMFMIIPPVGNGAELLLLDARKDPATFWSLVKSHAEMAIDELSRGEMPGVHNTQMRFRT